MAKKRKRGKHVSTLAEDEIMTVASLAEYLHCHESTIYRLLSRGALPGFRIGSDWRFSKLAIDSWTKSPRKRYRDNGKAPANGPAPPKSRRKNQ